MKSLLIAGIALAAISGVPALAADMPLKAPRAAVPRSAPTYNWSGFYIGANAGYGWSDPSYVFSGDNGAGMLLANPQAIGVGVPRRLNTAGFLGGGQFGYNWELNSKWVAGLEADIDGADVHGRNTANLISSFSSYADRRLEWFGTLRPRIGFLPTDRLLVFATGGLAYGESKASAGFSFASTGTVTVIDVLDGSSIHCTGPGTCMAGSDSRTSFGWTAGGGLEYAVTNAITVKAEYLYIDIGKETVHIATVPPQTGNGLLSTSFANSFQLVRAGIDYHFGAR